MFIVMFVSLSSGVLFFLAGYVNIPYVCALGVVTVTATTVSIKLINRAVQKSGRASLVVFAFSALMLLTVGVMPVYGYF